MSGPRETWRCARAGTSCTVARVTSTRRSWSRSVIRFAPTEAWCLGTAGARWKVAVLAGDRVPLPGLATAVDPALAPAKSCAGEGAEGIGEGVHRRGGAIGGQSLNTLES